MKAFALSKAKNTDPFTSSARTRAGVYLPTNNIEEILNKKQTKNNVRSPKHLHSLLLVQRPKAVQNRLVSFSTEFQLNNTISKTLGFTCARTSRSTALACET